MSASQRISAAIAYLPVVGWIYIFFFHRKDALVEFHLKQSIGLFLSLVVCFLLWAVVGWIVAWVPYGDILSITMFTLVMATFFVGAIGWVVGVINALRGKMDGVPLFGTFANRLPF